MYFNHYFFLSTFTSLLLFLHFPPFAAADAEDKVGCYKSVPNLKSKGSYTYQTVGYCAQQCPDSAVMALKGGDTCYCSDTLPSDDEKTDDDDCDKSCNGYPQQKCGGTDAYLVYTTGNKKPKSASSDNSSKSSSTSTSSLSATATKSSETVVVTKSTATASSSSTDASSSSTDASSSNSKSSGSNKGAIAAGVVVGIVGAGALAGAIFFFVKRRNRQQVEEEYRRNAQLSNYVSGAGGAGAAGTMGGFEKYGHDQRLDPSVQRRMSNGSIADDQDYSRKILKVTNPDSSYY